VSTAGIISPRCPPRPPPRGPHWRASARGAGGPFCSLLLAELGAEVIEVEPPGGDGSRHFPPFVDGTSASCRWVNRGKWGITLDLKDPGDLLSLRGLIERADVVVENFRSGVFSRLGLSPEALTAGPPARTPRCSPPRWIY